MGQPQIPKVTDYNENRPHSSLDNVSPNQYRSKLDLDLQKQGEKVSSIGNKNLAAVS
jgi:hypothetical protein